MFFVDESLGSAKSQPTIEMISNFGRQSETTKTRVGGVGGRGGVRGKRKSWVYVAGEHSVRDSTRRSEDGGGSMGYRLK